MMALDILGAGNFVVTTAGGPFGGGDQGAVPGGPRGTVARPATWTEVPRSQTGGDPAEASSSQLRRLRACRADWVAVHRPPWQAAGVLAQCQPGRDQDDGLDGGRERGDQALADRPAGGPC